MNLIKHILGNALFQILILSIALVIYIVYRIFQYSELWLISLMIIFQIIQMNTVRSQAAINLIRKLEPMKLFEDAQIISEEPIRKSNCLYCFHPHGIFNYAVLMSLYKKGTFLEGMKLLGSRVALNIPIAGFFLRLYGLEGVNKENFEKCLAKREAIGITPGGYEEATLTSTKENNVYIKNRKGFIKICLQNGTTIYPVFTFGENRLYNTFDKFKGFRLWLNKFKIIGTFFWSRFGTFPEIRNKLITVCGKGIDLPVIAEPSKQDIEKYHNLYINGLSQLYEKYGQIYQPKIPLILN